MGKRLLTSAQELTKHEQAEPYSTMEKIKKHKKTEN